MSGPEGFVPTPAPLVETIVEAALDELELGPATLALDPACGDGAFLVGIARGLARRAGATTAAARESIVADRIHGVEVDPELAELSRQALVDFVLAGRRGVARRTRVEASVRQRVRVGCALSSPPPGRPGWGSPPDDAPGQPLQWAEAFPDMPAQGFDLVLGNPPFLDSEWLCAHRPRWRRWLRERYPATARGNWDLYCPFVERALDITRPGGVHGFILPSAVASAEYASGVRELVATRTNLLRVVDLSGQRIFPRAVYPLHYLTRNTPPEPGDVRQGQALSPREAYAEVWPLGVGADPLALELARAVEGLSDLESPGLATVCGAATVSEAYLIADLVRDDPRPGPGAVRLINSGTIDPHCTLWGLRRLRYLGRSYRHPVVDLDALRRVASPRADQATRPKVVVAGNTRRLEAVADPRGRYLAGKSTTVVFPAAGVDPLYLAGVLNSALATYLYRSRYASLALAGGYMRVGPPQLRRLAIPHPDRDPPAANRLACLAADAQKHGQVGTSAEVDHLVAGLYGIDPSRLELVLGPGSATPRT